MVKASHLVLFPALSCQCRNFSSHPKSALNCSEIISQQILWEASIWTFFFPCWHFSLRKITASALEAWRPKQLNLKGSGDILASISREGNVLLWWLKGSFDLLTLKGLDKFFCCFTPHRLIGWFRKMRSFQFIYFILDSWNLQVWKHKNLRTGHDRSHCTKISGERLVLFLNF